jgi:hypothetical protein
MPCWSIIAIASCALQAGMAQPPESSPWASKTLAQTGGTMCWWTSMRAGKTVIF